MLDNQIQFEHRPDGACVLRASQVIPLPREQIFPFFADARNLVVITPPAMRFQIRTPEPITMHTGTLIDYTVRVVGVPLRWRTLISRWDPPDEFADEQLRGPYALWHHRHRFVSLDAARTRMDDEVIYRLPFAPLGNLVAPFVRRELRRIFSYRHSAIERAVTDGTLAARPR